jgi:hypothetical protein
MIKKTSWDSVDDWEKLGGEIEETISAVSWGPNRLDVFVRGTDNSLYRKYWNGSKWGPYEKEGYQELGG